jgi:tRNA pseudouridine55 synthase
MDIAAELGTLGYVTALRRLAVDPFRPESMVTLDALEAAADGGEDMLDRMLLAPDSVLVTLPRIEVGAADRQALVQGRAVPVVAIDGGLVRIYGPDGCFVGLGERGVDGALQPRRIFVT